MNISDILQSYARINTTPRRCYYVPFDDGQEFGFKNHIVDRASSNRFCSLDGEWKIKEYDSADAVDISCTPTDDIPVPSCVQCHGYDRYVYLTHDYLIPFDPPRVPKDNPTYHYFRTFFVEKEDISYYLNFEGVDSSFLVYVNKELVGYGNVAHSTNEFDVTPFIKNGENSLDVVVFKYSAGTYLESQDKFRFTGIFRSVYLLKRPHEHITDYKISTSIDGKDGIIILENLSPVEISYSSEGAVGTVKTGEKAEIRIKDAEIWSAETPHLYDLVLSANGEKILERVGIRSVKIEDGIFKINGKHIKLKGVNRHESNPYTGATVTVEDTIKDLELMKAAHVNAIRTSHYPDMPEFYRLCDYYGFYVMDEADVEAHGVLGAAQALNGRNGIPLWQKWADSDIFAVGVTEREIDLYERDKNSTCVIIWSLGNESSYGKMFYDGVDYIKAHDSRPVHYEGIFFAKKEEYYTDRIDIASRMYPELSFFDEYLKDEKETRPLVLCEYSHSMGNSNGDLNDYWNIIDSDDRFMGAFVWEWCDHAVGTENGFLYGGDWGENHHSGNYCVDGLVYPDRKIKSNYEELKAVYGGKREKEKFVPESEPKELTRGNNLVEVVVDEDNGSILSIGGIEFRSPMKINVTRALTDNDIKMKAVWNSLLGYEQTVDSIERDGNKIHYTGRLVKESIAPIIRYDIETEAYEDGVKLKFEYEVDDYIDYLPRIGMEFALDKEHSDFVYRGYGPYESYIDKHMASEYGEYTSDAASNVEHYIKPQETGSHYASTYLKLSDIAEITAETPFSFSVLPYSTEQLGNAKHDFELGESDATYVNLDIAMSGMGTGSCGPALIPEYRAKNKGKNVFVISLR